MWLQKVVEWDSLMLPFWWFIVDSWLLGGEKMCLVVKHKGTPAERLSATPALSQPTTCCRRNSHHTKEGEGRPRKAPTSLRKQKDPSAGASWGQGQGWGVWEASFSDLPASHYLQTLPKTVS